MNEPNATQPALELLFVLSAQTTLVSNVVGIPSGDRRIVNVVSGDFKGAQLSGRVQATGGDWVRQTPTSSQINARLLLQTHDGIDILLQYTGRASQSDGRLRLDVAGTFEAPQGAYGWLNDVQTFGQGEVTADVVRYHFYRFK